MTYQSSPVSLESVATDSLSSTNLAEAPIYNTDQRSIHQVNGPSRAVENEQRSALTALPKNINTAFQILQNHIIGLHPQSESEAEKASLSESLNSIRQLALNLYQSIPAAGDHQTNPEPYYEPSVEASPDHFTVFNDADADDSRSEDSYTLVDPSHRVSHSFCRESDNKENESFDDTTLPDWACTVTAGGCRVPLFWEGGDMGYFEYNQEQMKGAKGVC
jgi:hypothetical protein